MAEFTVSHEVKAPSRAVFNRLVDWDAHTAAIPLTRLHHTGQPAVGQRFVARTSMGPFSFDDPMEVRLLEPPAGDRVGDRGGVVEVAKTGRVIAGRVRWTVTPTASGARVDWSQTVVVPWLPRFADSLVGVVARAAYASGLRRILR